MRFLPIRYVLLDGINECGVITILILVPTVSKGHKEISRADNEYGVTYGSGLNLNEFISEDAMPIRNAS